MQPDPFYAEASGLAGTSGTIAKAGTIFTVEAFVYGYEGNPRLEVVFKVKVTEQDSGKLLQDVAQFFIRRAGIDLKHS
ncbi:hypothetical protein RQP46_001058 [Phenoliferia psychrophenolica]